MNAVGLSCCGFHRSFGSLLHFRFVGNLISPSSAACLLPVTALYRVISSIFLPAVVILVTNWLCTRPLCTQTVAECVEHQTARFRVFNDTSTKRFLKKNLEENLKYLRLYILSVIFCFCLIYSYNCIIYKNRKQDFYFFRTEFNITKILNYMVFLLDTICLFSFL